MWLHVDRYIEIFYARRAGVRGVAAGCGLGHERGELALALLLLLLPAVLPLLLPRPVRAQGRSQRRLHQVSFPLSFGFNFAFLVCRMLPVDLCHSVRSVL